MPNGRHLAPLFVLGLGGCALAPQYERPALPVAQQWSPSGPAVARTPAVDLGWRDFFADRRMQAVIALALENNRDLRIATLNVIHARALYEVERADLVPGVDATGTGARVRTPATLSPDRAAHTTSTYSAGLSVSAYELDLFGRVRSLRTAALEQYLATEEAQKGAQLALIAAVANQYVAERADDEQRAIAQHTLESAGQTYALTERSYEVGSASELDLRTSETQVQTARANLASLTQAHAQALNALILLVGAPLPEDLPPPEALERDRLIEDLPAGLPSEVLTRRPDVLEAEHNLKAANASIGAARAAFFPSIGLTAFGGTSSADLDQLFKRGSGAWNFTPSLTLPLFTGGRNRANLDAAKAEKLIEIAQYEKAIQTAFREVADELVARSMVAELLDAQSSRLRADEQRYALARQRYQQGIDSYVVFLTAQRDLYASQTLVVQARQARLTNLINLYKALGGGWSEHTPAASQPGAALSGAPAANLTMHSS